MIAVGMSAGGAVLPDDPVGGLALGECAPCHVVAGAPNPTLPGAIPSFTTVEERPSTTALSQRVFLSTPNHVMPNLILNASEFDDVISCILLLKP